MITIFTQPTCGQCRMVKMLLKQKGIEYVAVEDVDKMRDCGVTHTPTLLTNDGKLLTGQEMIGWIRNYGQN